MPMMIATPRNKTGVTTSMIILNFEASPIVVSGVVGVILGVTDNIILRVILLFLVSLTIEILLRNVNAILQDISLYINNNIPGEFSHSACIIVLYHHEFKL